MNKHHIWMAAALALSVQTGASFAEITLSTKSNPFASLSATFGTVLGAEKSTHGSLSATQMAALAIGPDAKPAKDAKQNLTINYTGAWLMAQPTPAANVKENPEYICLKEALYFESRGETIKGQFAVAEVILNRVDSAAYPNTICGVVGQGTKKACQFSYKCDGLPEVMHEVGAKELAGRIANVMLQDAPRTITAGATHFHTRAVRPHWAQAYEQTASIGQHLFYRK